MIIAKTGICYKPLSQTWIVKLDGRQPMELKTIKNISLGENIYLLNSEEEGLRDFGYCFCLKKLRDVSQRYWFYFGRINSSDGVENSLLFYKSTVEFKFYLLCLSISDDLPAELLDLIKTVRSSCSFGRGVSEFEFLLKRMPLKEVYKVFNDKVVFMLDKKVFFREESDDLFIGNKKKSFFIAYSKDFLVNLKVFYHLANHFVSPTQN